MKLPSVWLWAIKFGIGLGLLAFFTLRVDLRGLWRTVLDGSPYLYVVALSCFALSRLAEAVRLHFLLAGQDVPLSRVAEMTVKATFFNNFSLVVVGDAYRIHWVKQWTNDWERAISLVLVDRALGLLVVVTLAAAYLLVGENVLDLADRLGVRFGASVDLAIIGALLVLVALGAVFHRHVVRALRRLAQWYAQFRVLLAAVPAWAWVGATGATVTAQISVTLMTFVLVMAFRETTGFIDVLFVMVLVYLTAFVPVSIGALGVREGILILGLPLFGVTAEAAASVALASRAIMYLVAVAGGVWLLLGRSSAPAESAPGAGSSSRPR